MYKSEIDTKYFIIKLKNSEDSRVDIFFIFCTAAVSRHCSCTFSNPRIWQ